MISFPKINVKNLTNNFENNRQASFGLFAHYTNLAPLQSDTVTFSGRGRTGVHKRIPEDMREVCNSQDSDRKHSGSARSFATATPASIVKRSSKGLNPADLGSQKVACAILDEIEFAYGRFKNDIGNIFNMPVIDVAAPNYQSRYFSEVNANYESGSPILAITARKKSRESLMEKMGTRKITTKKGAKEGITDIMGIRILLSGATDHPGDYVMEKLTEAVNKGWIKIVEIENMKNPNIRPYTKYAYANQSKIDNLAAAIRKKGTKNFANKTLETESGYTAIHILCEFPENIKGELQIIGPDVLRLKEIEDICYKTLSGKHIPKKYREIEKLFAGMKEGDPQYVEFMDYTRKAYAHERKRKPHPFSDFSLRFLELPEDSTLPAKYDFNAIESMKATADKPSKEK